jgi:hypothetical protein
MKRFIIPMLLVLSTLTGCATSNQIYSAQMIAYGRIIKITPMLRGGGCGAGDVAIGAGVGLYMNRDGSAGSKVAGAAVGGAASCAIAIKMGWTQKVVLQYDVLLQDGQIFQVVTDPQRDVLVTDCIEIGYVGNQVTSLAVIDPNIGCKRIGIPDHPTPHLFG